MRKVKMVKMQFTSPVRFGEPGIGLERASKYCPSDTLFSAILNSLARITDDVGDVVQNFLNSSPPFRISSAFPFSGERFFIKKPLIPPIITDERGEEIRRELKGAEFISLQTLKAWIEGIETCKLIELIKEDKEILESSVKRELLPRVQLDRLSSTSNLFYAKVLHFAHDAGLWFAVDGGNEGFQLVEIAMRQLSDDGIGGERSSGMGRFDLKTGEIELPEMGERSKTYLLLSLWWPNRWEQERKVWRDGTYEVIERRGWAFSSIVRAQMRRKSVLMFSDGSVFWKIKPEGGVADVTPLGWPKNSHKIYRYGLAFTISIGAKR